MSDPNANNINTPRINRQVETLKRLREAGELVIGWEEGQVSPPTANALLNAGLAITERPVTAGRKIYPAPK